MGGLYLCNVYISDYADMEVVGFSRKMQNQQESIYLMIQSLLSSSPSFFNYGYLVEFRFTATCAAD